MPKAVYHFESLSLSFLIKVSLSRFLSPCHLFVHPSIDLRGLGFKPRFKAFVSCRIRICIAKFSCFFSSIWALPQIPAAFQVSCFIFGFGNRVSMAARFYCGESDMDVEDGYLNLSPLWTQTPPRRDLLSLSPMPSQNQSLDGLLQNQQYHEEDIVDPLSYLNGDSQRSLPSSPNSSAFSVGTSSVVYQQKTQQHQLMASFVDPTDNGLESQELNCFRSVPSGPGNLVPPAEDAAIQQAAMRAAVRWWFCIRRKATPLMALRWHLIQQLLPGIDVLVEEIRPLIKLGVYQALVKIVIYRALFKPMNHRSR